MGFDFAGKRTLVTGASSGIGAAAAIAFAEKGAVVGICARREDRLAAVLEGCRRHSPRSSMWVCDLADPEAPGRLAAEVESSFGGIDILVNNAGIPKRRHTTRLDPSTVETVMAVNYLSPVRLTLAVLPAMVQRGSGHIVNVSSVAATLSSPGEAAYDASKAALTAFSEAMAVDLWDTGIKVLIVYPGLVDTELFSLPDNDPVVPGVEPIAAAEVARAVIDALERDARQVYVPGYFADFVATKVADLDTFMAGAAAYVSQAKRPGS